MSLFGFSFRCCGSCVNTAMSLIREAGSIPWADIEAQLCFYIQDHPQKRKGMRIYHSMADIPESDKLYGFLSFDEDFPGKILRDLGTTIKKSPMSIRLLRETMWYGDYELWPHLQISYVDEMYWVQLSLCDEILEMKTILP